MNINIKGLHKAEVLFALWHASHAQGLSWLSLPKVNFSIDRAYEITRELAWSDFKQMKADGSGTEVSLLLELKEEFKTEIDEFCDSGKARLYFDYVDGHVIKCDLSGDEFNPALFDRDCGEGAAAKAIENLRENGIVGLVRVGLENHEKCKDEAAMGLIDMLFRAAAERRVKEDNDEN